MSEEQFQNVQARKASDTYFERGLNSSTNCHSGYHEDCMMRGCSCKCHSINRPAMTGLPSSADLDEKARKAAKKIEADCLDRRGIKWQFQDLDDEIREEILQSWTQIIVKEMGR